MELMKCRYNGKKSSVSLTGDSGQNGLSNSVSRHKASIIGVSDSFCLTVKTNSTMYLYTM